MVTTFEHTTVHCCRKLRYSVGAVRQFRNVLSAVPKAPLRATIAQNLCGRDKNSFLRAKPPCHYLNIHQLTPPAFSGGHSTPLQGYLTTHCRDTRLLLTHQIRKQLTIWCVTFNVQWLLPLGSTGKNSYFLPTEGICILYNGSYKILFPYTALTDRFL
jgi:hypothetical protein